MVCFLILLLLSVVESTMKKSFMKPHLPKQSECTEGLTITLSKHLQSVLQLSFFELIRIINQSIDMYMHIIAWRHQGLTYDLNSALSNIIFSSSMSRTNKYDIFNYSSSNLEYHQWSSYEMQKSKLFVL